MFFLVSKLLSLLVNPTFYISLSVLLSYFLKGKSKYSRKFLATSAILFFTFSNPFLYYEAMRQWEPSTPKWSQLPVYDVGIVLGTTSEYDAQTDRIQFVNSCDRLFQAIQLYKTGKIRKILYVGGSGELLHPDDKEGVWIARYLLQLGIPSADFAIENNSRNTHENATMAIPYLKEMASGGKYLLITSAYHMYRAQKCFQRAGVVTSSYCVDRIAGPLEWDPSKTIIPNAAIIGYWYTLNHEWLGCLSYKLMGYI